LGLECAFRITKRGIGKLRVEDQPHYKWNIDCDTNAVGGNENIADQTASFALVVLASRHSLVLILIPVNFGGQFLDELSPAKSRESRRTEQSTGMVGVSPAW